jgi:hypothetical protein
LSPKFPPMEPLRPSKGAPNVPIVLLDIEKDSKRFPATKGWAYAQFNYDPASGTFPPEPNGVSCGFQCHTRVAAKDYIFTAYGHW